MQAQLQNRKSISFDWPVMPALRGRPLMAYFVLTYGFSWFTLMLLGAWLHLPDQLVVLVFTMGPTAAAVIMTAVLDGRKGLGELRRHLVLWRVAPPWYLVPLIGKRFQ